MVACEDRVRADRTESVRDGGTRSFFCQTLAPMRLAEMESELVNPLVELVGTQSCTTDEIVVGKQEYRPILDAAIGQRGNFSIEAGFHLVWREWSPDPTRDFRIAPQGHCKRKIIRGPTTKTEASGVEEIRLGQLQNLALAILKLFVPGHLDGFELAFV
jgi:hypothetical protein